MTNLNRIVTMRKRRSKAAKRAAKLLRQQVKVLASEFPSLESSRSGRIGTRPTKMDYLFDDEWQGVN